MVGGNAAILNHLDEERRLRVFWGVRGPSSTAANTSWLIRSRTTRPPHISKGAQSFEESSCFV
jgi:hypothetical protein